MEFSPSTQPHNIPPCGGGGGGDFLRLPYRRLCLCPTPYFGFCYGRLCDQGLGILIMLHRTGQFTSKFRAFIHQLRLLMSPANKEGEPCAAHQYNQLPMIKQTLHRRHKLAQAANSFSRASHNSKSRKLSLQQKLRTDFKSREEFF